MANLLLGSSNVARFYKFLMFQDFKEYQMMKCTNMDSFSALMSEIEEGSNNVIVSVIENLIVDAAKSAKSDGERVDLINKSIKKVFEVIEKTSARLPDSKFCFVMPLRRPAVEWFDLKIGEIEDEIRKNIASLKTFNVTRMKSFCVSQQQFETDGVHLTKDSGFLFVEAALRSAEEIFNAVNVEKPAEDSTNQEGAEAEPDMKGLVSILKLRFEADNMMFARLREEVDSTANKSREDRVVVTGVISKDPLPTDNRQRIERLKVLVAEVFQSIKPGFKGRILYASQGRNNDTLPMLEVKLDSSEYAVEIRKAFAEKRKKDGKLTGCLERIFLSNSINIGTRVRIEILKAIAKRISNTQDLAYVASFISRPVIHIKPRTSRNERPTKSYTFIDAVKQFGSQLKPEDLLDSYAKAGRAFAGQLEQNFVVLKESDSEAAQTNFHKARMQRGRGRGGRGADRGRERGAGHGRGGGGNANTEVIGGRGQKRPNEENLETSSAKK
jgi:hypothetical protein